MKQLRFRRVKEFNFSNNNMIIVTFVSETIARNTAIKILKDAKLDVSVHNNMLTIIVSNILVLTLSLILEVRTNEEAAKSLRKDFNDDVTQRFLVEFGFGKF